MIKTIIDELNKKLPFSNKIGLAELVTVKDIRRPMYYLGAGEWKDISFDKATSTSYWRKENVSQSEVDSIAGCTTDIERTYRLKLVAIVDRKELDCDDAFADDRVADDVISKVTGVDIALKKAIKARSVNTFVDSYTTDNESIERREYTGIKVPHKYVYLSLDISVDVVVSTQCLKALC